MFIPNPDLQGDITPYQLNIMREYRAEYNLELGSENGFISYPSRLNAIYLFESSSEAHRYKDSHLEQVGNRILKKVKSVTSHKLHDSIFKAQICISTIGDNQENYTFGDIKEIPEIIKVGTQRQMMRDVIR